MTLDLNKLNRIGLGCVREQIGATGPDDTSYDTKISKLSPREYVQRYAAWQLGDPSWGATFYDLTHEVDAGSINVKI